MPTTAFLTRMVIKDAIAFPYRPQMDLCGGVLHPGPHGFTVAFELVVSVGFGFFFNKPFHR